ncbi:50S ribosomal protein L10 [Scatolibacter rhodanostii]|uniref:50S ribosomal protein L10 n=1 Tax=Scatolibacter rhodanostii TaxID=2014781 RepID=UPI000C07A74A|nr:50S ribosomal protein L10 [Scatolibacter rhodanostii]
MPSEKVLEKKKVQVAELSAQLKEANVGVLVSYSGITVERDTKLRKQLREAGCTYKVVKNSVLSRAFKEVGIDGLDDSFKGTTAIAIAKDDYVSAPKILTECAKDLETFSVKAGFIDGSVVDEASIVALAKLPSKEVLVAQALYGLNAPIQGFANVLNGTIRGLAIALNAIAEQKESA